MTNPIKNLDVVGAVEKLGGSEKLYYTLIKGFKGKYSDTYERLVKLSQERKYNEARILAHSIKGLCGNLGSSDLQSVSKKLEDAYKEKKDSDELLEDYHHALKLVLEDIEVLLKKTL